MFFVARDGTPSDAEDVEELVVEALGLALFVRLVSPFPRESGGGAFGFRSRRASSPRQLGVRYTIRREHREYAAEERERLCEHRVTETPRQASLEAGEFSAQPSAVR